MLFPVVHILPTLATIGARRGEMPAGWGWKCWQWERPKYSNLKDKTTTGERVENILFRIETMFVDGPFGDEKLGP